MLRKTWEQEYVARILGYPEVVLDCAFWRLPGGTVLELLEYVVPGPGASTWRRSTSATATSAW